MFLLVACYMLRFSHNEACFTAGITECMVVGDGSQKCDT